MKVNVITSKDNPLIKKMSYLKGHQANKFKNKYEIFVVEGFIPIQAAIDEKLEMVDVFTTQEFYDLYKKEINDLAICKRINLIPNSFVKELSNLENAKPIFATFKYPFENELILNKQKGNYVLLDNIQDPGNLGTIIRTALGLGIDGIWLFNCVSIYNPKTIKGSMGAVFSNKIHIVYDWNEFLKYLKKEKYVVYGSLLDKKAFALSDVNFDSKSVLVLGNEANGINKDHINDIDHKVYIPMFNNIQSLNVAVAGGIIMQCMTTTKK